MSQGMQRSGVPWCDYRWNPVVGCSPASEGCDRCYARSMARRFGWPWGHPQYFPSRLEQPLHTAKPGRVFVCSTSDLFHPEDDEFWNYERRAEALKDIWNVMALCQQHTFLVLTKRPLAMRSWVTETEVLPNVWLGVTAENQKRADERIPMLLTIPAEKRWVSFEPLLGEVTFSLGWFHDPRGNALGTCFDWCVAGPETGPGARRCADIWINMLALSCRRISVAFFDKRPMPGVTREWPNERGVA